MKGGKEGHLRVGGDFEDGRKGTLKERPREGGAPRQVSTHAQEGGEHGRATAGLCGETWRAQLMGKREAGRLYRNFEWTNELGEKEEGRRRGAFGTWQTAPSTPGSERLSSRFLHSLLQKWQSGGDMDHPASGGPLKGELAERGSC